MNLLCFFAHKWVPVEVFHTHVVDKNGKEKYWADSWHGYECTRCGERKIVKSEYTEQSVGATQNAYNWLNENRKKQKELGL